MVAVLAVRIADPSKIVTGFNRCVFSLRPKTKPPHLTGGVQMRRLCYLADATFREEVVVPLINWRGVRTLRENCSPLNKVCCGRCSLLPNFYWCAAVLQHRSSSVSRDAGINITFSGNIPRPDINRHKGVFTCPCGMRQAGRVIRPLS